MNQRAVHGDALAGEDADAILDSHPLGGEDLLLAVSQHAGRLGRQMHQLLDPGSGSGDRQFLEQAAELHNERDLTGGERLTDADGGDQRQRYQHVRLDVEGGDQPDHRLRG